MIFVAQLPLALKGGSLPAALDPGNARYGQMGG